MALTSSTSSRSCLRGSRCTAIESAPTHSMRATYCPVSGPTASQRVAHPSPTEATVFVTAGVPAQAATVTTPTVTRELGAPAFG